MKSLRPQEQHHEQLYKVFPICKSLSISVLVVEKCILWQLDYLENRPGKKIFLQLHSNLDITNLDKVNFTI